MPLTFTIIVGLFIFGLSGYLGEILRKIDDSFRPRKNLRLNPNAEKIRVCAEGLNSDRGVKPVRDHQPEPVGNRMAENVGHRLGEPVGHLLDEPVKHRLDEPVRPQRLPSTISIAEMKDMELKCMRKELELEYAIAENVEVTREKIKLQIELNNIGLRIAESMNIINQAENETSVRKLTKGENIGIIKKMLAEILLKYENTLEHKTTIQLRTEGLVSDENKFLIAQETFLKEREKLFALTKRLDKSKNNPNVVHELISTKRTAAKERACFGAGRHVHTVRTLDICGLSGRLPEYQDSAECLRAQHEPHKAGTELKIQKMEFGSTLKGSNGQISLIKEFAENEKHRISVSRGNELQQTPAPGSSSAPVENMAAREIEPRTTETEKLPSEAGSSTTIHIQEHVIIDSKLGERIRSVAPGLKINVTTQKVEQDNLGRTSPRKINVTTQKVEQDNLGRTLPRSPKGYHDNTGKDCTEDKPQITIRVTEGNAFVRGPEVKECVQSTNELVADKIHDYKSEKSPKEMEERCLLESDQQPFFHEMKMIKYEGTVLRSEADPKTAQQAKNVKSFNVLVSAMSGPNNIAPHEMEESKPDIAKLGSEARSTQKPPHTQENICIKKGSQKDVIITELTSEIQFDSQKNKHSDLKHSQTSPDDSTKNAKNSVAQVPEINHQYDCPLNYSPDDCRHANSQELPTVSYKKSDENSDQRCCGNNKSTLFSTDVLENGTRNGGNISPTDNDKDSFERNLVGAPQLFTAKSEPASSTNIDPLQLCDEASNCEIAETNGKSYM